MKIEAQGKEAIIRNSNGDVAIIPIQHVREVMDMIKDGCHGCIDKYVSGLPKASNYAEDGTIIPDDPVINLNNPIKLNPVEIKGEYPAWIKDRNKYGKDKINFWESLNYKKWGLNDYSDYSSFNSAFRNARESNEKEFVYKGNRYNTNLISRDQSELYWESKKFLEEYYKNNDYKPLDKNTPGSRWNDYVKEKYGYTWQEFYNDNIKDRNLSNEEYDNLYKELDKLDEAYFDSKEGKFILKTDTDQEYLEYAKRKNKQIELDNLNDNEYYFSITDRKPDNMKEDGYNDAGNKKIFMTTNAEQNKLNTTYIHELSHKADDYTVDYRVPKVNIDKINKNENTYPIKSNETFSYLSNPSEIEARKMSLLFYNYKNKIDISKYTVEDFEKYQKKHYDNMPYDIQQLFNYYTFDKENLLKYLNNNFDYLENNKTSNK